MPDSEISLPTGLRLHREPLREEIDRKVWFEQVSLFWSYGYVLISLGLAVGAALMIAQWPVIRHDVLLGWFVVLVLASLGWGTAALIYRRHPPEEDATARWDRLGLGAALVYGLIWGSAGLFLFPVDNFVHQAILTVMLAGVSAGAVTALSSMALTGMAFLIPTLIPVSYRFALAGTPEALLILSMLLVLLFALVLSNRHLYTTLRDSFRLRIEKALNEAALHESESRYRLMFNQSPLGVLHYDTRGVVLDCNNTFIEILGTSWQQVIGTSMINEVNDPNMAAAVRMSLETGWGYYEDTYDPVFGIHRVPLRAFFNAVTGPDEETLGGVAIVEDFSQRKQTEEALNRQAFVDALTGLPNRRLLGDRLNRALISARRHGRRGALIFLDLDHFKRINDWLGHGCGDQVLQTVGERLIAAVRSEDTVARLSGDEFILLVPEIGTDEEMVERAVENITEKIQSVLQDDMIIDGHELRLTASMGVTLFPRAEESPEELLRQSDTAMYLAKKETRGEIRFHTETMDLEEEERLGLENELRFALEREQLRIAYQPLVDSEGSALGGEALLRWHHPEYGDVSPQRFIHVAESSGLIIAIGRWVLDNVCRALTSLPDERRERMGRISVNVSAREFHHADFARHVEDTLDRFGLDGRLLTLEVTENVLIDRVSATVQRIERLKKRGIRFEVDDFGTGYSSLTYLKRLPVDGIKIDRSFVRDVETDDNDAAIVDAILAMASRLNLDVVAEGVESEAQFRFLRARGCRLFQGFLWAAALPWEEFLATPAEEDERPVRAVPDTD